jgi:hypothetical protein
VALGAAPHDLPIDLHVEAVALDDVRPPKMPAEISRRAKLIRLTADAPHVPVSRATILRNIKTTMANFTGRLSEP